MAKRQKVLILRLSGPKGAVGEGTLERHLDVQDLPKLLADGWTMVSTSAPDEQGQARIVLEKDVPDDDGSTEG